MRNRPPSGRSVSYYTFTMKTPYADPKPAKVRIATVVAILSVLLIGIASSVYVFTQVDSSGKDHILERAATIAVAVPQEEVRELAGTEDDLGTPAYEQVKLFLEQMRSANHDARFLYLIGQKPDGALFFYADSEPAESEDYSPPGQVYYEATDAMYAVFANGRKSTEGPDRDRWGLWISGYAPVVNEAGDVVAMLGMDLPANRYLSDVFAYSVLPLLVAFALILIIVAMERSRRQELAYLEQKAEFLSIASHEIRTPLTGIRWAIEGLLKRENPPVDPKTRALLALVHESCLGLLARVNNLLDLTALEGKRTSSVRMERILVRPFLEDIMDSLALSARQRQVTLRIDASISEDAAFVADRQMMHHAFFNLLTNAIKYTKEGTDVSVSYQHADGMHAFRVTDKGEGVEQADQDRIFAGYYRTREAVRSGQYGTGLGLYLVRKAAELHGGSVSVSSKSGEGATFSLQIPDKPVLMKP